jgi:hypothetical protein
MPKSALRMLLAVTLSVCIVFVCGGCAVGPGPLLQSPLSPLTVKSPLSPLATASPTKTPLAGRSGNPCPDGCQAAVENCKIKGIVTSAGEKYYYAPDMPGYEKQVVLTQNNARWFCTVDDAVRNGFRKP